jgi:hypothetical protein
MRRCYDHQANADGRVREYHYLICMRYSTSAGKLCQRNKIDVTDFTAAVVGWVRAAIDDPLILAGAAESDGPDPRTIVLADVERARQVLAGLVAEERRWDDAYRRSVISLDRFGQGLAELATRRQRAELELASLTNVLTNATSAELARARRDEALTHLATSGLDGADPAVVAQIHQVLAQVQVRDRQLVFVAR